MRIYKVTNGTAFPPSFLLVFPQTLLSITGETQQMKLVNAINDALDIAMETDSTAGREYAQLT